MKYSEIDLHSNNSVVVVTDEQDRVLEEKRVCFAIQSRHLALADAGPPR